MTDPSWNVSFTKAVWNTNVLVPIVERITVLYWSIMFNDKHIFLTAESVVAQG